MDDDGNKPYSIETEKRGPFLHVTVGGVTLTPEMVLDYWHEIINECEIHACSKILLEHNFVEMIDMPELLQVITPVAELLKGRTLAFYDRYSHFDVPEAGKRILRSHDIKMQIFNDLEEAERWLLAN